ncbi:MAG: 50S ribosomal protein L4 [Eggerthellaceae bacterium]|nr:50S ribosomal protein L4 [Eggerthellaceae bacterium]
MATIEMKDASGKKVKDAELSAAVFEIEPNVHVMHEVVRSQRAARRQGTHDTLTRGQVRGGGKKPWRQKGTGRARQGTIRAPQWAGGGTVFGPHPRSYAFKVPAKVVKLAMRSALSAKLADGEIVVVDQLSFEKPSTKQAAEVLKNLGLEGRVTIIVPDDDVNTFLSFRNLSKVRVIGVSELNTLDFIDNKALVLTDAALTRIEEVLA